MVPGGPEEVEPDDLLSERHAGQFIMAGIITYPWARPHGYNLELKKKKAASRKLQATSSLTRAEG